MGATRLPKLFYTQILTSFAFNVVVQFDLLARLSIPLVISWSPNEHIPMHHILILLRLLTQTETRCKNF